MFFFDGWRRLKVNQTILSDLSHVHQVKGTIVIVAVAVDVLLRNRKKNKCSDWNWPFAVVGTSGWLDGMNEQQLRGCRTELRRTVRERERAKNKYLFKKQTLQSKQMRIITL